MSSISTRAGFYWCRLTAWLDLGFVLACSLRLSLVKELSGPQDCIAPSCTFLLVQDALCSLWWQPSVPFLQRKQVHLFTLLSTPAIHRSDYKEEVAWAAKVERKKILLSPSKNSVHAGLRKEIFLLPRTAMFPLPSKSHNQSSESIDFCGTSKCWKTHAYFFLKNSIVQAIWLSL